MMTDHPHPKLLEEVRSALSTAEWHIGARMIELRDARQPAGETAAALNKVRDAIRDLKGAIVALETAPPTPPSGSLVETLSDMDIARACDAGDRCMCGFDPWDGEEHPGVYEHRRRLAGMRASFASLTAHPAADAPPSPAGVSDETRCECGEIINPGDMVYLSIDGGFLHAECCGDEDSFVDFETGEPPKIAPQPFRYES